MICKIGLSKLWKNLLLSCLILFIPSLGYTKASLESDSFTVIRDGIEYLCERKIAPDPYGNIRCQETAYRGPFSSQQAKSLCENSYTELPALCGIHAYNGPFLISEAITLCQYAKNIGPAECAIKAYNGPFSKSESIELCKTMGTELNADCAIKAYNGSYSKKEAIEICKATRLIGHAKPVHLSLKGLSLKANKTTTSF